MLTPGMTIPTTLAYPPSLIHDPSLHLASYSVFSSGMVPASPRRGWMAFLVWPRSRTWPLALIPKLNPAPFKTDVAEREVSQRFRVFRVPQLLDMAAQTTSYTQ